MAKNHEDKVYAGGIRNRLNRITLRIGGEAIAHCNSNFTDQHDDTTALEPRSVISRTTKPDELNVQRSRIHEGNPPVMDNDV